MHLKILRCHTRRIQENIDSIPREFLEVGNKKVFDILNNQMTDVFEKEKLLKDCQKSIICTLYKKGDRLVCKNYWGISVL